MVARLSLAANFLAVLLELQSLTLGSPLLRLLLLLPLILPLPLLLLLLLPVAQSRAGATGGFHRSRDCRITAPRRDSPSLSLSRSLSRSPTLLLWVHTLWIPSSWNNSSSEVRVKIKSGGPLSATTFERDAVQIAVRANAPQRPHRAGAMASARTRARQPIDNQLHYTVCMISN